jgi:hypothetical protein
LKNNTLSNLTRLYISQCRIGNDGFIALVSALEQNTSLLHLDLYHFSGFGARAFLALAESLPEIKILQRVEFDWCRGFTLALPLVLAGLRKNTSLFRFHVENRAPDSFPPTSEEIARYAGDWMQEMKRLGYRNRCLALIRMPEETHRGIWPHALARVATLPDDMFQVLRSKPSLVPSEDTEGKEAATYNGVPKKRKRGDK